MAVPARRLEQRRAEAAHQNADYEAAKREWGSKHRTGANMG